MSYAYTTALEPVTYSCGHTMNRDFSDWPKAGREKYIANAKRRVCLDCALGRKAQTETKKDTETKENTMDNKNLTDDKIKAIWKNFKKEYKAETGWSGVAYMNAAQLAKRTATIRIYWTCKKETAQDRSDAHDVYEKDMARESVKKVVKALGATATFEYSGSGFQYGGPVAKIRLHF